MTASGKEGEEENMADPQGSGASRDSATGPAPGSLRGVNLLRDLPDKAVADLEKICRWESYGDGDLIFDRTDTSYDVYFIAKGRVRVVGHAKSGQEVAFVDLGAGQHFGELSAFDKSARSATLYTLEDTLLAIAPGDVFIDYTRKYPNVALRLMEHVVATIRTLNKRVVGLSTTTVIQRVYNEILQLAEPDPSNPNRWVVRLMPNHKELAVWAGTVPEMVAKAIGKLLESGVAKREYKTLYILDRRRLQKMINE